MSVHIFAAPAHVSHLYFYTSQKNMRPLINRMKYVFASVFLAWHTLALTIAPLPDSYLREAVYPLFKPYLILLHMNVDWSFFAPNPASGILLRYIVTSANQTDTNYKLTEAVDRHHPAYLRYMTMFSELELQPQSYVKSVALFLCNKHLDISPIRITFVIHAQQIVWLEQYLKGVRPLDKEYMTIRKLDSIPCPSS